MVSRCPHCSESVFGSMVRHQCKPSWRVWSPDFFEDSSDSNDRRALDAEDAVLLWAEQTDGEGDYTIVQGADVVALACLTSNIDDDGAVIDPGKVQRFTVTGESVPSYNAIEVK